MEHASRPGFAFAKRHGATVAQWDGDTAILALREGVQPQIVQELKRHLKAPLKWELHKPADFEALLQRLYEHDGDDARQMAADLGDEIDLDSIADSLPEPEDLLEADDDAPIIRLINALLTEAVKENASDIHVEPQESRLVVRFRVDGVMREVLSPPRNLAGVIASRIKVMAKMDIAEKRLPQDGRISLKVAGRPVDVRVSTIPAGHGERVVLRLLDKQAGKLDLRELGMEDDTRLELESLLTRPHGIFLVTGPTGSGKTTTLYAGLSHINDATRNIMTVEDPIEYYLDGIGQTQVNTKVDMSFARGLKAILRQDPDVVMVGEIRDLETAQIAVQASLTGHLVLSTLHTNSAVGAIARLRDMGVEPFLLSSSLIGVLAQRLIRRLDPEQSETYEATAAECQAFGHKGEPPEIYRPRVDLFNRGTGYKGRSGIYELISVDDAFRDLIHKGAGEAQLIKQVRKTSRSLLEDGWKKVLAGVTSAEEVLRVTRSE